MSEKMVLEVVLAAKARSILCMLMEKSAKQPLKWLSLVMEVPSVSEVIV